MSFQSATPQGAKTKSDVWITPQWIIDKIGISDLDPCGWKPNGIPIVQTASNYFLESDDGLSQDWSKYKSVFVNFPYSNGYNWLQKCKLEADRGCQIIVLCFVRSETKSWQQFVKHATGINLMNKRVSFLNEHGIAQTNANAPSCLIAYGSEAFERIKSVDGILLRTV